MLIIAPRDAMTEEQRAAVACSGGNTYVGAGPGTGKTFLLVERYRFLRDRGVAAEQILVLTFSRRAAGQLKERLVAVGFSPAEIDVRTFHGFAVRVIGGGTALFRTGRLLDGFSRRILLDAAIEQTPTPALSAAVRASRTFRAELETVLGDLNRAPVSARTASEADGSPRLRDVLAIARWSATARARIGGNEIGDLVSRAVADAQRADSPAARWLAGRYAHVLVDEFQDTDRVQLELLATLGATIFAVGDEAQSIYRFRGASNDIVAAAQERFAMQRFELTESRRCPPDVCALASQAPIPNLAPLRSARGVGEPVEIVRLRAVDDEVAAIADAIEADLDAGTPATQIAVLVRSFRPLGPLLVDELRRRSIAVASIGREELLADTRIRTLRAALDVLDRPADAAHWERLLASRSLRFDPIRIRFAGKSLRSLRLNGSLGAELESVCAGGVLSGSALAAALLHASQAWQAGDIGTAARRLVRRLRLLAAVLHDEPPVGVRAAAARLKLVCDALAGAQRTAAALSVPARPTDLLARFDDLLPALALDDAGIEAGSPGVRVLTVHASKGLEFERVFVADAVAGRFPQDARPSTLLDKRDRDLLANHGLDGPSVVPDAAALEEASLWYVALTRCKNRLTITFADQGLNGDLQRPSRFIPVARRPDAVLAVNRESLAMRALRNGTAALRDRVLAGAALDRAPAMADYARSGPHAFAPLDGYPLHLSKALGVGDAELWLQCPRRLFYKKFAKLSDAESAALVLGSTIHDVLERFHTARVAFHANSIDTESWTSELLTIRREHWDAGRYTSPALARAAETAADVALRSYARALAARVREQPFTVEAREQSLTIQAGTHALAGRTDRIDLLPDASRVVVDYKLGAAKSVTVTKAAQKIFADWRLADAAERPRTPLARRTSRDLRLQLGFYATALENVAAIAYVFLGGDSVMAKRNGAVYVIEPFADALREIVTAALAEIEADLLAPLAGGTLRSLPVTFDPETCMFCPYIGVCPGPAERDA